MVHLTSADIEASVSQAAPDGNSPLHTPTPWHHGVSNRRSVWSGKQIKSTLVANCYDDETESAEQEANAALIVKAVNAMPDVRFLLDRLAEFDPGDYDAERDFHGHVAPAIARLRNAIA